MGERNDALNLAVAAARGRSCSRGCRARARPPPRASSRAGSSSSSKKKVLLASCDVYRPAAIEQLKTLAEQVEAEFFPSAVGEKPVDIARARARARAHALRRRADRRHRGRLGDRRGR